MRPAKTHELKILPKYFVAVISGAKTFEIREKRDRDFQVGDILWLRQYLPYPENRFTGLGVYKRVSYISEFFEKEGFVVMSIV
jgi:hypothetical protein